MRWIAALAALPALLDGGVARLVDDLAYGAGVWKGVVAERNPAPLLPHFTAWPGRSSPAPEANGSAPEEPPPETVPVQQPV